MFANSTLDYGYPWWLSYGHVTILIPALLLLTMAKLRRWPTWTIVLFALFTLWSAGALAALQAININGKPPLPTETFLASGEGRVLDIGAGTGRSSIMVLTARPKATLVATDLFGESFEHHFGHGPSPQQRLQENLNAAGVATRAAIETVDMRKLPYERDSFDGIVSSYAVDHLNRQGITSAMAEANRVLKPGHDFLLILINNDFWTRLAFGPLLSHGGTRGPAWWKQRANEAGLTVIEEGTSPATQYYLLRKLAAAPSAGLTWPAPAGPSGLFDLFDRLH